MFVRLQTFGKKCIEEGGSEINVPLTELEIQPKQTYYIIMELIVRVGLIFYLIRQVNITIIKING